MRLRALRLAMAGSALLMVALCARSQSPSQAEIEKRMEELKRSIPVQIEDAARRAGVENRRVDSARIRVAPATTDPMLIADRYRGAQEAAQRGNTARVMVFASFSMPAESLKRLAQDASRAGVPLYFRGLRYGFGPGKTQRGLAELQPLVALGASVQIHPEAFESYSVRTVPTFVVAGSAAASCESECRAGAGVIVGDVSLSYALEKLSERGDEVGAIARSTLGRMSPGPGR